MQSEDEELELELERQRDEFQHQRDELQNQHAELQRQCNEMQRQYALQYNLLYNHNQEIQRHHSIQIPQIQQGNYRQNLETQHQMQRQNDEIQSQLDQYLPPAEYKCSGMTYEYLENETRQSETKDKMLKGWHHIAGDGDAKRYRANYEVGRR